MKVLAITLLFILSTTILLAQSPVDGFFRGQGNTQIFVGAGAEASSIYAAADGPLDLPQAVIFAAVGGAYGIADGLDVSASVPFIMINDNAGLQDGRISVKYRLLTLGRDDRKFSFQLAASGSAPLTDYDTERSVSIGQQAQVLDGRAIIHFDGGKGIFVTAQGGYMLRSDPTPDAFGLDLKIGRSAGDWYYDVWGSYSESDGGFNYRGTPEPPTFRALGVDAQRIGGTLYRRLDDRKGVYLGLSHTLDGRNVRLSTGIGLGVVFSL